MKNDKYGPNHLLVTLKCLAITNKIKNTLNDILHELQNGEFINNKQACTFKLQPNDCNNKLRITFFQLSMKEMLAKAFHFFTFCWVILYLNSISQ
jgi:hypothetical protein